MEQIEKVDVLIVGSGPAGASAALHLALADPRWTKRIVVIEKAVHPREKLCGGGITHMGQNVLARLGLSIEFPHIVARQATLVYRNQSFSFYGHPVFRIVRRSEFDHWLVQETENRGIRIRQGETVQDVSVKDGYVEVRTDKAIFHAKVVIAADGSKSTVRRKLKWDDESRVARLLEILTPQKKQQDEAFRKKVATFDFTPMSDGLQGYYWDFPSLVEGVPYMNRGIFDSQVHPKRPKIDLVDTLRQSLLKRDLKLDDYELKGHPIRWYDNKGRYAIPHVLLAGDAAGTDVLMGEGISFALAYGQVAAETVIDAFDRGDYSFNNYHKRFKKHYVLRQLSIRTLAARLAYRFGKYQLIDQVSWPLAKVVLGLTQWRNPDFNPVERPQNN